MSSSKEQILDAAQAILAVQGYTGLSMRELAAESGLAKATIYHHFQDKGDVLRHVLERDMNMVRTQLEGAVAAEAQPENKIKALIRTYFGLMRERRTIIINVMRELGQQESNLCEFISESRGKYFATVRTVLEEGIATGVFRPLNVEHTALSMIGMINAFVVLRLFMEQDEPDEMIVEQTVDLFFHGVCQSR